MRLSFVRRRFFWPAGPLWLALSLLSACGEKAAEPRDNARIWEEFSGERALAHVQQLVDFGPRPPATRAIEKARSYLSEQLSKSGWTVSRQAFTDETPRGRVNFVNLIARYRSSPNPIEGGRFLVCSHYDTKSFDSIRFVGANDGGSSTGVLLELARVLGQHPALAAKIELVFFDGEEAYETFSGTDGLYGSRYFAKQVANEKEAKRFRGGILLDMVGDRDLTITLPPDSPSALARDIFASAEALSVRERFTYFDRGITDDHTPLNAAGISTIDLIDFDFPWWHTSDDTMDKISAESLSTVGRVTAYYLARFAFP